MRRVDLLIYHIFEQPRPGHNLFIKFAIIARAACGFTSEMMYIVVPGTCCGVMADKKLKKGGQNYCSAVTASQVNCSNKTGTPGISMHYFPSDEIVRDKWTQFVRIHRNGFVPKKSSCLCSAHFDESCFEHKSILVENEAGQAIELKNYLIKGSIPTKDTVVPFKSPLTSRKRQKVSCKF
mgnify:CR=1 FL=1